jgi:hypothetical protein
MAIVARHRKKRKTDKKLRERIKNRSDPYWIHEHDVEEAFAQVLVEEAKTDGLILSCNSSTDDRSF